MNIIGCLDRPTSGEYILDGEPVSRLSDDQLATIRNRKVGFVFQSFNLLSRATALANVELPLRYSNVAKGRSEKARLPLNRSGCLTGSIIAPMSFQAGSSSVLPLHVPW